LPKRKKKHDPVSSNVGSRILIKPNSSSNSRSCKNGEKIIHNNQDSKDQSSFVIDKMIEKEQEIKGFDEEEVKEEIQKSS
jgi:hypothetical protein